MDLGIFGAYWISAPIIAAVLAPIFVSLVSYAIFRVAASSKARSWTLGVMLLSSIFLWLFVAASFALCFTYAEAYKNELGAAVSDVFAHAILVSIAGGAPLALILRHFSPRIILRQAKGLAPPSKETLELFASLAQKVGVPSGELRISNNNAPISVAIETKKPIVVISNSLLSLLKNDELEAVMAHELAHVKNGDTTLKAFVTAYRTALPHDPIVRLVEAAFHREREILADEIAVKVTQRPLSLASALLKIYDAFPKSRLGSYGRLSLLGSGSTLARHPPILQRVNRLIHIAEREDFL